MRNSKWFFLTCIAVALVASLNPIYYDEIAYDCILGRYFRENGHSLFIFPECTQGFRIVVPPLWKIPRILLASVYDNLPSLVALRLFGVALALCNILLLYRILLQACDRVPGVLVRLFVLSTFIGHLPFLSVMARPEGLLLFLTLLAISTAQFCGGMCEGRVSHYKAIIGSMVVVACGLGAQAIHPVGVILAPIYMGCLWTLSSKGSRVAQLILCVMLGAAGFLNVPAHSATYYCPESPGLSDWLGGYGSRVDMQGIVGLFAKLPSSFLRFAFLPIWIVPGKGEMFGILPESPWTSQTSLVVLGYPLVVLWMSLFYYLCGRAASIQIRDWRASLAREQFGAVVCCTCVISLLGIVFFQPQILPYRLVLTVPLMILTSGLVVLSRYQSGQLDWCSRVMGLMACSAILSTVVSWVALLPEIIPNLSRSKVWYHDLSTNQFVAVDEGDLNAALEACDLSNSPAHRRVILDHRTYWGMRFTSEPIFHSHFLSRQSIEERQRAMRPLGVTGVLADCEEMRELFGPLPFKSFGQLCCLSKQDIDILPSGPMAAAD